jgi:hypothetical protein
VFLELVWVRTLVNILQIILISKITTVLTYIIVVQFTFKSWSQIRVHAEDPHNLRAPMEVETTDAAAAAAAPATASTSSTPVPDVRFEVKKWSAVALWAYVLRSIVAARCPCPHRGRL